MTIDTSKTKKAGEHRICKWYPADDAGHRFVRRQKVADRKIKQTSIKAGTILILLSGRYRGKRVIFLKQLASGMLLVTGPHKINGVPIRRVNRSYVIATKTIVDINDIPVEEINDELFKKLNKYRKTASKLYFQKKPDVEKTQKEKEIRMKQERKAIQSKIDKSLITKIKPIPMLEKYLSSRFSLTNTQKPHEMKF